MKSLKFFFSLLALGLCLSSLAVFANQAIYPYTDPYYATLTTAILKADETDSTARSKTVTLRLLPQRNQVPFYGPGRNHLTLKFWQAAEKNAPLLVFIAGFGGQAGSGYADFLSSQWRSRGFHVLILPSPFHFTFALSASASGMPGITRRDAADLYRVTQEGILQAREKFGVSFSKIGLLGVSMGALESAYLSEIDRREQKVGFQKILLINPPVNPSFGLNAIDQLANSGSELNGEERRKLLARVALFGAQAITGSDIKNPAYFLGLETRLPTTPSERKYLIGSSMRDFLPALLFTTQQVNDLGVLQNPVATTDPNPRLEEAKNFSFDDYIQKFLLPSLAKEIGETRNWADLERDIGMIGVETELQTNPLITVLHNEDDFIVDSNQLNYLRSKLGERAVIFPHGGHIGNIWFPENLAFILNYFTALK